MTKEEAIGKHRAMWKELAESGADKKPDINVRNACYLCEYGNRGRDLWENEFVTEVCSICPLEWPILLSNKMAPSFAPCERSFFELWRCCTCEKTRKLLAYIIANLPKRVKIKAAA